MEALKRGPKYGEVCHTLGLAYGKLGQRENAANAFQDALRAEPDRVESYFALANSYSRLEKQGQAVQAAENGLRLKPDSAIGYLCLGCAIHLPGTYDQAVAAYKESLKLNPGQFEALANLGDGHFRLGRAEGALNVLIQAEAIKLNDSKLHDLLGEVYIQSGTPMMPRANTRYCSS